MTDQQAKSRRCRIAAAELRIYARLIENGDIDCLCYTFDSTDGSFYWTDGSVSPGFISTISEAINGL